jgi:hypothetical protein
VRRAWHFSALQDNLAETDTHTSHEDDTGGWARMISLNSNYPNCALTANRVEFGRKSSCTVQIKHPAVSGVHMEILNNGGGEVWLKDLSTNGTYINGVIVGKNKSVLLQDGVDIILIKSATDKIGYKFVLTDTEKKELVRKTRTQGSSHVHGSKSCGALMIDRFAHTFCCCAVLFPVPRMLLNRSTNCWTCLVPVRLPKCANASTRKPVRSTQ